MQPIIPHKESQTGYPPIDLEVFTETLHSDDEDYSYSIASYNGRDWVDREGQYIIVDSWVYCGSAFTNCD